MKVTFDQRTDTVTILFRDGAQIAESEDNKPGFILDYDDDGNLVSLEVLDASRRVSNAGMLDFQVTT